MSNNDILTEAFKSSRKIGLFIRSGFLITFTFLFIETKNEGYFFAMLFFGISLMGPAKELFTYLKIKYLMRKTPTSVFQVGEKSVFEQW